VPQIVPSVAGVFTAGYAKCLMLLLRRGGRVVECTALEMRHTGNRIGGSNPSLSANNSLCNFRLVYQWLVRWGQLAIGTCCRYISKRRLVNRKSANARRPRDFTVPPPDASFDQHAVTAM
jgi:hypothetical protein